MTRRLAITIAVAALVSASCSDIPHAQFEPPEGFIPFVADSNDNVGLGNDIAVTADGVPYVSYFGFEAKLDEGEIAPARPVWAPFIPAVQLASVAQDGSWTQGAVAQSQEFSNVPVPFGPSLVESLKGLKPGSANGTSIAVGEDGTRHVAWASNNGIWYASSADTSSVEQVSSLGTTLSTAGPIGRPGIAVVGDVPWIAWTANTGGGQEVRVATPQGNAWRQEVLASIRCGSCPAPLPTEVGVTSSGPLVVFVNQSLPAVTALHADGARWTSEVIATNVAGLGLSLDVTDDVARVAYYTGDGSVEIAEREGTSWATEEVGTSGQIEAGRGNFAPTTGVAVGSNDTVYVAWDDAETDSVRLAKRLEGAFEEVVTSGTEGGRYPSLAAANDQVFMSWYEVSSEDLLVGVLGGFGGLLVAQPSPTPDVTAPLPADCGDDGEIVLDISAQTTAFSTNCLVAPAGEPFTISFDNQDPASAHNVAAYTEVDGDLLAEPPPPTIGPIVLNLDVPAQKPGQYFFNCQAHPTQMTGVLAVVGGGGN